jgi:site-specific DNA recombinase
VTTINSRPAGTRVAIYCRVSTDEQAKSGYSLADQKRELLRHAEREGYEIVETIVDEGYSGASRERPGLDRILELAEAGEMELAIATKRDRWFRSRLYLPGVLRGLEDKGERLMNLALDGPFGKDEIARRAASLDVERDAVERQLDGLGGGALEGRLRELEELPDLVEGYLRDLPHLVGRQRVVRGYDTIPEEGTPDYPLGLYRLTPDRVRRKTGEEIKGERLAAQNERSARLRSVYEAIGLTVTAHKDGTLLLRWSCGMRTLPAVTG